MDAPFPDIEVALLDWLEATWDALRTTDTVRRVDTETPANLQEIAVAGGVFVRVSLVTGADDRVTDRSIVDIDVLSDSRATAYAWAEDIRSRLTGSPHRVGPVVIDRAVTEEKPRRLPWADENTWRFGATYRISARR